MSEFQRLVEIIEDFKEVRDKTNLQITADALFSNARALFISEMIARQRNYHGGFKVESPATEKQINFLKILKVNVPYGLTKRDAIKLIKEKTEGDNEE